MTKNRYVVFDVETPNRHNNRMSAIGITVVKDGRIVDQGTHQELMKHKGYYYELYSRQYEELAWEQA